MGSPWLELLLLVYVKTLMCFKIHSLDAFLREFTYLQILRLAWKESIGQEYFKFRKLTNCEISFSSVRERKKRNRRLGFVNIFLNRHLLLLHSHRYAEVTDTSHLHKPLVATSHKLGVGKRTNPTAQQHWTILLCVHVWQALTTLGNAVSNITDF